MPLMFLWDESYSVDNAELDAQHRRMFEFANMLPETMDKAALQRGILAIAKHARLHFETEERVMKEMGYPGLDGHRETHNHLITRLNEYCEQPLEGEDAAYWFKKMVFDWVIDHIMHCDMGYVRFLREQRDKAA